MAGAHRTAAADRFAPAPGLGAGQGQGVGPATTPSARSQTPPARLAIGLIRLYQLALAPAFRGSCRFAPSCSEYAREAIERHGAVRGILLSIRRLSRCHPFGAHGVDLVP